MFLRWRPVVVLPLAMVLLAFLPVCARATPTPPSATPTPAAMTEGKMLYEQKCAACHGTNAEGTAAAPAIAGHSMAAMKTQVRNPLGEMPAFPQAMLSDRDLDELAEFIAGMGMAREPAKEWEKAAPEITHHWMALLA